MKFKDLEIGDSFKSPRFENLVFVKTKVVKRTCCTPGYNAKGVGHDTKTQFSPEDEVTKIEVQK